MGQARGGSHKTPPPGAARRLSVSESLGGMGGASLAQFARVHGGHTLEREERKGLEVLMAGQERLIDMFEDLIERVEKVEEAVTPNLKGRPLSEVPEESGFNEPKSRAASDIEIDNMLKNLKVDNGNGGDGE